MTPQEVFNRAFLGVYKQGRRSVGDDGWCSYLSPNGDKCAAGHVFNSDQLAIAHHSEGDSFYAIVNIKGLLTELEAHVDLVDDLQSAHDSTYDISLNQEWPENKFRHLWHDACARIAMKHNLAMPDTGGEAEGVQASS